MTSKHGVRGEGATRGGRTAAFAQASVQERLRSAVAPTRIVCAVACSRSNVLGERVYPPRTFLKRIATQDPSRCRRHRHAMLFEHLAPPARRMPASACGALSTYDSLLFSTMFLLPQNASPKSIGDQRCRYEARNQQIDKGRNFVKVGIRNAFFWMDSEKLDACTTSFDR
ncbi:hypothetical protein [Dictyobacter vulcani]|uniref:hypothetical protein n=1 Tax=Dictyobacter vulcani TaxID=2607529 RepID=UPI001387625C|nr:hypothetical protein [Dictyobacter vulcani]